MKWFGMILLLISGTEAGMLAAGMLRRRSEQLRLLRQLIVTMMAELKCTLPLIPDMLRSLAAEEAYQSLSFLQNAAQHAEQFPDCWTEAVMQDASLTDASRKVLLTVGETLGSTALDGQLAVLEICAERFQGLYEGQEKETQQRGKLYQSMGILCSIFFVIILL